MPGTSRFLTRRVKPPRILVVDDESGVRDLFRRLFREEGIEADVVGSGKEAIRLLEAETYVLAVVDLRMPEWDGVTTIKAIEQGCPGMPILVVTGVNDAELHQRVRGHRAVIDVVSKPFENKDLIERIRRVMQEKVVRPS